jgi:hypothetical protein
MKWCCFSFKANYRDLDQRGVCVVAQHRQDGRVGFKIKCVAVDKQHQGDVLTTVPVAVETTIGIQHCPWCGVRLDEWYQSIPPATVPDNHRSEGDAGSGQT